MYTHKSIITSDGLNIKHKDYCMQVENNGLSAPSKVKIDLIVIGNPNSGKTSLIHRFIEGETSFSHFYNPTLGLSLEKKIMKIGSSEVTVCIWDTAGQQKFFSLTKSYFKKADGVIVVFDLTDKSSFERVDKFWMNEIKQKSDEDCSQVILGNKSDMTAERQVQASAAKELATRLQTKYFQTSAKSGQNVDEAIQWLVKECLSKVREDQKRGESFNFSKKQERSSCVVKQFFQDLLGKVKD